MRIVAGTHRGRPIAAPDDQRIRPTSDRIRESLFNILHHRLGGLSGRNVLDAFAGTGALGLEALSRGAASARFCDSDGVALSLARRNAASLGLIDRSSFQRLDATKPPPAADAFDLALLDPPYGKGLGAMALAALDAAGWLTPDALIVIEADKAMPEAIPPGFTLLDNRDYGRTRIALIGRHEG
jgi:16S rRNA (guanine966-N2)-methyltransferase